MSARRSSHPSVQLFPFLAVLMCALGALILMLLVTTSRMRDQVRAERRQQAAATAAAQRRSIDRSPAPARDHWQPATLPPDVKLQPSPIAAALPQPAPTDSLRAQWLQTVTDLQSAAAAEEAALQAARAAAESEERSLSEAKTRLADLQQDAAALDGRRAETESDHERDAARLAALELAIARESSELTQLREKRRAAAAEYKILPYDGRSGTIRRPIYIECTESGLTFASEKITLTPQQLNGFPAVRNPLRAGADALIDYWSLKGLKNSATDPAGQPYVLLIVRPKGTVGYYVARRMLETLGQQFGYELVTEDLQLQWPPTDPGAVAACRAAIEAAMQERDHFVARGYVPPGSLEPLSVSDGSGTFALEEVERLRGNGRKIHFGGREFDRTTASGGQHPVGPGSLPPSSGNFGGVKADVAGSRMPPQAPGVETSGQAPGPFPMAAAEPQHGVAIGETTSGEFSHAPGAPSPSAVAAQAAAGFSASAGSSGGASVSDQAGSAGEAADDQPRPLPSLDATERDNLSASRPAASNPAAVLRDPGSQIGLERKVNIRVESQRIAVESEPPIVVMPGMSREELQAEVAATLRTHFEGWGRPPRSFYWLPQVSFTVLPGGHQNLKRLTDLTEEWEMSFKVDYALE